jgi:glutamate/tyrosine decarboxylase-like PLP-dependent enzyme
MLPDRGRSARLRRIDGAGDPLGLGREEMRALGYRTVDALVDWLSDESAPALRRGERDELAGRLGAVPEGSFDEALRALFEDVLPYGSRSGHPRFFAYIPFAGTWPGALGDFVASAANVYAGSWQEGAGPTQLELEILDRFKQWIGYPPGAAGSLVSGGSLANLTALACAREALVGAMRDDLVLYASDQAHSSIGRAARVLGFRPDQLRVLPVDDAMRLEPETLAEAVAVDVDAGRRPFLVAANAGATSTGAVDPLAGLSAVCRERGLWLHVDASYGGFAVLTERGRAQLGELAAADSVTLDPHKWLYQPYECGCLLVREGAVLRRAFELRSDYLRDAEAAGAIVNFGDYGLQLSRTSRALKLWLSLQTFGLDAFRAAIDRTLDLAVHAAERIRSSPRLELAAPPSLGVVCFTRDDGAVDGLVAALEASGLGLVSSTRVDGREALRLCILNHTSTEADVDAVLDFLEQAEPVAAARRYARDAGVSDELPLFARLDPFEAEAFVALSVSRLVEPGARVVTRWEMARELYVIESGSADVLVGDEVVATLRAGDHFGEIAALDWGHGFARSRAADVLARGDLRLRVLDEAGLRQLLSRFPRLEDELRREAHARLRRAR